METRVARPGHPAAHGQGLLRFGRTPRSSPPRTSWSTRSPASSPARRKHPVVVEGQQAAADDSVSNTLDWSCPGAGRAGCCDFIDNGVLARRVPSQVFPLRSRLHRIPRRRACAWLVEVVLSRSHRQVGDHHQAQQGTPRSSSFQSSSSCSLAVEFVIAEPPAEVSQRMFTAPTTCSRRSSSSTCTRAASRSSRSADSADDDASTVAAGGHGAAAAPPEGYGAMTQEGVVRDVIIDAIYAEDSELIESRPASPCRRSSRSRRSMKGRARTIFDHRPVGNTMAETVYYAPFEYYGRPRAAPAPTARKLLLDHVSVELAVEVGDSADDDRRAGPRSR